VRRLPDGEILLARQFRYPTLDKGPGWVLEVPAGVVEDGEDPIETMRRELVEELGYEATHIELIAGFYVSPGGSSERVFLYYAEVAESGRVSDGGGVVAEGEDITIESYTLDELVARMDSGDIVDAKTLIGIQWLVIRDRSTADKERDATTTS
jgi:ADP-ribose pyrophosphatase